MHIAALCGINPTFERWGGRGQNHRGFFDLATNDGHIAGMVMHTVFLFVSAFMFFIDNDEAQMAEGEEQS